MKLSFGWKIFLINLVILGCISYININDIGRINLKNAGKATDLDLSTYQTTPQKQSSPELGVESIKNFQADINLKKDGSVDVTETISADGKSIDIKHGIYRDLPLTRTNIKNEIINVSYQLLGLSIDNAYTPFHTEKTRAFLRIYLGDPNKYLTPGIHTYTIHYLTNQRYGSDDKVFGWNITGNEWLFPIENVTAKITTDKEIKLNSPQAFEGFVGDKNNSVVKSENDFWIINNSVILDKSQGLSIFFNIDPSSQFSTTTGTFSTWIMDQGKDLLIYLGLLLLLISGYLIWDKIGRDPMNKSIAPEFEPVLDPISGQMISPATVRYLMKMSADNKTLTTTLINLAVKGFITIKNDKKHQYQFFPVDQIKLNTRLSEDEKTVYEFIQMHGSLLIENTYNPDLQKLIQNYKNHFTEVYKESLFKTNGWAMAGALILGIGFGISVTFSNTSLANLIFAWIVIILGLIGFIVLIPAYTQTGSELRRQMLGFKMFLSKVEKNRMNFRNPPELTPEIFEKYLPYALALDVDQKWSQACASVLANTANIDGKTGYYPIWYIGIGNQIFMNDFANSFSNDLSSTIMTAGTPPSSSGGGFSGGGGGGGGGGGW